MGTSQFRKFSSDQTLVFSGLALALLAIYSVFTPSISAQDTGPSARAIRLSYVDGKVKLSQGDQPIAEQAGINTPLLQGMTISSADDGKAEIQFEDGSVARIAPNSTLTLTTLAGTGASAEADLTLERGEGYFELQSSGQAGVIRIHFGDSLVTASGYTVLRAQYDTPPGTLAVFAGNAHLERGNSIFLDLRGGQSLAFNGNSASSYDLTESIPSDSWDAWNSDRDQALNAELASQTPASSDLSQGESSNPAWSDLDSSGSWYNVPGQGYIWSPYEAANPVFDPYGYGRWVWIPSYGYTWASSYSWGYMPFSCGAWNYYNSFGWGWAPGFGGCTPWWRSGIYVGVSIGYAPGWYHPIPRPAPPRVHPWPGHPIPMIAVRRNEPGLGNPLPPRDRNTPVTIGGATVIGLRPFPGRTLPHPGAIVRGTNGITQGGGLDNHRAAEYLQSSVAAFIAPNAWNSGR
jgi:FecR protein